MLFSRAPKEPDFTLAAEPETLMSRLRIRSPGFGMPADLSLLVPCRVRRMTGKAYLASVYVARSRGSGSKPARTTERAKQNRWRGRAKNSARQWHLFLAGLNRAGFEPLILPHAERLKTGANSRSGETNRGRAEFFALPITNHLSPIRRA